MARHRVAISMAVLGAALAAGSPRRAFAVDGAIQNTDNGHWYLFVQVSPFTTWANCKAAAEATGGYLATITSAAEQQFLSQSVPPSTQLNWWLGGSDSDSEGNWSWITGEAWSYANWGSGEPNNCCGGEHWLQMGTDGRWNDDLVYATEGGYVVEWNSDPNAPVVVLPPAAPTQLTAIYDEATGVSLAWTDNSTDETGFTIERKAGTYAFARRDATDANVKTWVDQLLYPSTTYTYRVRAFNSGGDSAWSNEASIVSSAGTGTPLPLPPAPNQLTADAVGGAIDLAWTDNSADETLFGLERAEGGAAFALRNASPAGATGFTDDVLHPGWPYTYRVRALSLQGPSPYSNIATATLPATLTVTPGATKLVDSPKLHRDKLKVAATLADDDAFDPATNGLALQLGPSNALVPISIRSGDAAWKSKRTKLTWKSAKGATPKVKVVFDTAKHALSVTASGFDFAAPPEATVTVLVASGASGGAGTAPAPGRPYHVR